MDGNKRGGTEGNYSEMLRRLLQRLGVAAGLVFGVAVLGALALVNMPDLVLVRYDDGGRSYLEIRRNETQRLLDQARKKLSKLGDRRPSVGYHYTPWIGAHSHLYLRAWPRRGERVLKVIPPNA